MSQTTPKKRRGLPGGEGLDGKNHQPPPANTTRRDSIPTQQYHLPVRNAPTGKTSPGAPSKPYPQLCVEYQDRYAISIAFMFKYLDCTRIRTMKF